MQHHTLGLNVADSERPKYESKSFYVSSTCDPLHSIATRSFSIDMGVWLTSGSKILCSVQSNIYYVQVKVGILEKGRQKDNARATHR